VTSAFEVAAWAIASEGYSHRALAQRFGDSQSTIFRVMQRYRETGDHVRRPGHRRHRATTPAQDRYLKLLAVMERLTNTRRLQMQLARGTNVRIGLETIRQRLLEEDNLHTRRKDNDIRVRIIRRPNELYAQCNILGRQPFGGSSVMVWRGVPMFYGSYRFACFSGQ
jgi:transposase